MAGIRDRKEAV